MGMRFSSQVFRLLIMDSCHDFIEKIIFIFPEDEYKLFNCYLKRL